MELPKFSSPESGKPDKPGDQEAPKKKKKKTTRIPLPVTKSEAKDSAEVKSEERSKSALDELFVSNKKQAEKLEISDDTADEIEIAQDKSEIAEEIQSNLTETKEPEAEEHPLEGEFVDEATIITRYKSLPTDNVPAEANNASEAKESLPEAPDVSGEVIEPLLTPEIATTSESQPDLQESIPDAEPEPPRVAPPFYMPPELERQAMIDPNVLDNERIAAELPVNTEETYTSQDLNRAAYRAEKRGKSSGVLAGGIFGYWIGRRELKRELASSKQEIGKQQAEINSLVGEQSVNQEKLKSLSHNHEELKNLALKLRKPKLRAKESQPIPSYEMPTVATAAEAILTSNAVEKAPDKAELLPESNEAETLAALEGRRIETSAWHRIEVDAKTGRAVDNPELEYGEEFKKEQKQERLAREASEPQVAVHLGQTSVQNSNDEDIAPKPEPDTSLPPEQAALKTVLTDKKFIVQQIKKQTTSPTIWVIAVIVVVFLLLLGVF
jgi:hypothetical protein